MGTDLGFGRLPEGTGASADADQALVSDQAASRLAPTGFDPSRNLSLSKSADNVRPARTKSLSVEAIDIDELVILMLMELHANIPESDRPMSMSDLSDEQAERARRAISAVLVRSMMSKPVSRVSSLAEIDGAA